MDTRSCPFLIDLGEYYICVHYEIRVFSVYAFTSSGMIHAYSWKVVHSHTNMYKHIAFSPLTDQEFIVH